MTDAGLVPFVDEAPPTTVRRLTLPSTRAGYVIAIVGVVVYVMGTLLPYAGSGHLGFGPGTSVGYVVALMHAQGVGRLLAGLVSLFGIAGLVLVCSIFGIRSNHRDRWAFGLLGASSFWLHYVLQEIVFDLRSWFWFRFASWGLWVMDAGIALSFAGGTIVYLNLRRGKVARAQGKVIPGDPGLEPRRVGGFYLALAGVLLFTIASFLPYDRLPIPTFARGFVSSLSLQPSINLFGRVLGPGVFGTISGVVSIYGPVILVGMWALSGVVGSRRDRWAAALLGAAAAWSMAMPIRLFDSPAVRLVGFWGVELASTVVLIGAIVAVLKNRVEALPLDVSSTSDSLTT